MDKAESICICIMLIIVLISWFKAGKCFNNWEILKAIFYEIMWIWMIIIVLLRE